MGTNNPSIRGHQGEIKLFENGALVDVVAITDFEVQEDKSFTRSHYVGKNVPEGDTVINGWTGSFSTEIKNDVLEAFIDRLNTANLNGIGYADYTLLSTEFYPDGKTASYVWFGNQFKLSKSQKGLNEKMTRKIEFQSDGRTRL